MTPLLDALLDLIGRWEGCFSQERTFTRAVRLALAQVADNRRKVWLAA